jgi:hypothetical protein
MRNIVILSLVTISILLFPYYFALAQPIRVKTFEDPILGYSIQYPQDWNITSYNPSSRLLNPNGTSDVFLFVGIFIGGYNPSPQLTIYDHLDALTRAYKGEINFSLINSTIINPPQVYQPAIKFMTYNLRWDIVHKEMSVWIPDNNAAKMFAIRYTAPLATFAKFLPVVNEMIKSFKSMQVR